MAWRQSARANALDLMPDPAQFAAFAEFLGVDKVEFKDFKTPVDMVTEITKSVIDCLGPKP